MSYQGHIANGAVIFDEPVSLPEGTPVRVEAVSPTTDFWQSFSLDELARRQGVVPPQADEEILAGWPADELDDGFEDAVRRWREVELEQSG
jgi:hypothetical protein